MVVGVCHLKKGTGVVDFQGAATRELVKVRDLVGRLQRLDHFATLATRASKVRAVAGNHETGHSALAIVAVLLATYPDLSLEELHSATDAELRVRRHMSAEN
jgi:hypothetical protein